MEIEQIRQALERELGDKWRIEDGGSDSIFCIRSNTYPFSIDIELHMWQEHMLNTGLAAIGRALLAAAGETMIPLREAVRVVEEAFRFRTVTHKYDAASNEVHTSVDGVFYPQGTYKPITEKTKLADAIAALQALGGGG